MIKILKPVLEDMVVFHHDFASWIIKQIFEEKKTDLIMYSSALLRIYVIVLFRRCTV